MRRVVLPILFLVTTAVIAGCAQLGVGRSATTRTPLATDSLAQSQAASTGLGQDDPRLDMNSLAGVKKLDPTTSAVHVLPEGNVPGDQDAAQKAIGPVTNTTTTRWLKSTTETTLWSGPDAQAAGFTRLPEGSYVRVIGPDDSSRTPVYYAGDGWLRNAGNGWVDATTLETVEAPAPGQVPSVDADAKQPLPQWVQAHTATKLWSGPDEKAVTLTDLPQWTFLKVAGLERGGRLLVNYAGDYSSRQPGIGWVDQTSIGPAGDPGVWLTNHRATALWSGTDEKAARFTDIPQWTKLRIVEDAPPDATRLEVEYFGDGATRQPGLAWIARADVGPITPPVPLPALPSQSKMTAGAQIVNHTFSSTSDFINTVGEAARRSQAATGVPASVTVAQAILESDWGRSRLTRQGNNLFGIKALGGVVGPAGVVSLATWEHINDGDVVVQAPFRAYFTIDQSIDDHGRFFTGNRRYAGALALASDAQAFARAIQAAGYATDPAYAQKLISLMDRYNLYQFDQ